MRLSEKFSIDPKVPWVRKHNKEVRDVLESYEKDKPIRVPLFGAEWFGAHGFYTEETNGDYREYYTNPDEMVRVQLEAARRKRELPIYDMILGEAPKEWHLSVDLWPIPSLSWLGCELLYRKDNVIAHRPLNLSKEECRKLSMPDPVEGGILKTMNRFWKYIKEKYQRKTFLGRPIGKISPGVLPFELFNTVLSVRGPDIMLDMYEDPEFALEFINKIGDWGLILHKTWTKLASDKTTPLTISDHGTDMLSVETYEEFIVPIVKRLNKELGTKPPQDFHHCGRGIHLFPIIKKHFGLKSISALTYPLVDIARIRKEVGYEVRITAMIEDSIIQKGPPEKIYQIVKELLTPQVKGKGRFALMVGDMLKGTSMKHRKTLYEAVKEYGRY